MRFVIIIISSLVHVNANQEICVNVAKEDTNLAELTLGIRLFSKVLMKHVKETQIGNYVVSPLSLHLALGMISIGAGDSTSYELHRALGTDRIKYGVVEAYGILSAKLWTLYSILNLDQKMLFSKNFIPKPYFVSTIRKGFANTSISVLDFISTQSTVEVTKWASQTFSGGSVGNFPKLGEISRNNSLIISSALNFMGVLANRLKVKYVPSRKFYINETSFKDVPMIHVSGTVIRGLLPEIRASFIKYHFTANEISMIIIRSNEVRDFIRVDEQLENINMSIILERGDLVNMSFFLPKFKVENTLAFKEIVQKMGVVQIFNASANFSGISDQGLKVDQIIQKISVGISENRAAAASSSDIRYSKRISRKVTESFDVNMPFHFIVLHERTKLPLIQGRITNPAPT